MINFNEIGCVKSRQKATVPSADRTNEGMTVSDPSDRQTTLKTSELFKKTEILPLALHNKCLSLNYCSKGLSERW